jgi:hypothetical protein
MYCKKKLIFPILLHMYERFYNGQQNFPFFLTCIRVAIVIITSADNVKKLSFHFLYLLEFIVFLTCIVIPSANRDFLHKDIGWCLAFWYCGRAKGWSTCKNFFAYQTSSHNSRPPPPPLLDILLKLHFFHFLHEFFSLSIKVNVIISF